MTAFEYETVISTRDGAGVRTVTLNRPAQLNAMNRALIRDVAQAFDDANVDEATRAIVLTGAGRAFCAGDDRHEHRHPASEAEARELVELIQSATRAILLGPKPVVGAINGYAVGGGFEWAINCDFPIWAESAIGFFPEVSLNLFVTGGVTRLLPRLVGLNRAREMLFFGERYDAKRLLEAGVAWRVVADDEALRAAQETAARLAALPARSVRAMKRLLYQADTGDFESVLARETDATVEDFLDPLTTELLKDF